jgi:TDG/mug DNA glycosylase family protein
LTRPPPTPLKTLPDFLAPGLRLLSIGLNPSLRSVAAGYYFANPRNRFCTALNASTLLDEAVTPGAAAVQRLFKHAGIGFTDLVKRPTRGAAELRAADFKAGTLRLQKVIEEYQPVIAWFHGKLAYKQFLRQAGYEPHAAIWGLQSLSFGATQIFVTPNPSPANAAFSLRELAAWYDALADQLAVDRRPLAAARNYPE